MMKRWGLMAAAFLFALVLGSCGPGPGGRYMGGWGYGMHGVGYGGFFMWLLLVIVAVGVFFYFLKRDKGFNFGGDRPPESALDIAKRRYASGEISREEFERLKQDLQ